MDEEDLKNEIADCLESALDDLDELKIGNRGITLRLNDGTRWFLRIDNLDDLDED